MTLPSPKEPRGFDWTQLDSFAVDGVTLHRWKSGPVLVTSSIQIADMPDGNGTGPTWLISVSDCGRRPKPHHVRRALRAFDMVGAEEDNHHPGVARHFFLVCDPSRRVDCECKVDEDVIRDADGYRWTNPKAGEGDCRGCEFGRISGKPCPVHPQP